MVGYYLKGSILLCFPYMFYLLEIFMYVVPKTLWDSLINVVADCCLVGKILVVVVI